MSSSDDECRAIGRQLRRYHDGKNEHSNLIKQKDLDNIDSYCAHKVGSGRPVIEESGFPKTWGKGSATLEKALTTWREEMEKMIEKDNELWADYKIGAS